MPKLWNDTIQAHRLAVRDAILGTTWALVTEHGLTSVTMSQIAEATGIGRATLYKYFPDVEAILLAWHDTHVARHLHHLMELRDRSGDGWQRLEAVLEAYAFICHRREHHGADVVALLHRDGHLARPQEQLVGLIRDLLAELAQTGDIRTDVGPGELANFCVHALAAAGAAPSHAAVRRLVTVTVTGLRA